MRGTFTNVQHGHLCPQRNALFSNLLVVLKLTQYLMSKESGVPCKAYLESFKDAVQNGPYLDEEYRCRVCLQLPMEHASILAIAPQISSATVQNLGKASKMDSVFKLQCIVLMQREIAVGGKQVSVPVHVPVRLPSATARAKVSAVTRSTFSHMLNAGLIVGYPDGILIHSSGIFSPNLFFEFLNFIYSFFSGDIMEQVYVHFPLLRDIQAEIVLLRKVGRVGAAGNSNLLERTPYNTSNIPDLRRLMEEKILTRDIKTLYFGMAEDFPIPDYQSMLYVCLLALTNNSRILCTSNRSFGSTGCFKRRKQLRTCIDHCHDHPVRRQCRRRASARSCAEDQETPQLRLQT